jgi:nucleoside-diphosphate-sugar epimerase
MQIAGVSTTIKKTQSVRAQEISIQRVDTQKAKKILQWEPAVDLETGIAYTIQWYRDHYALFGKAHI